MKPRVRYALAMIQFTLIDEVGTEVMPDSRAAVLIAIEGVIAPSRMVDPMVHGGFQLVRSPVGSDLPVGAHAAHITARPDALQVQTLVGLADGLLMKDGSTPAPPAEWVTSVIDHDGCVLLVGLDYDVESAGILAELDTAADRGQLVMARASVDFG